MYVYSYIVENLTFTHIFQVNLSIPVCYLMFWVLLLGFSLYSEPMVCGVGLVIMLTGVPVYLLGIHWKDKPLCIFNFIGECLNVVFLHMRRLLYLSAVFFAERVTFVGQRLCLVVFPQLDPVKITNEAEWTDQYSDKIKFSAHS